MKKFLLSASLLFASATSWAAPQLQKPAPDFSVQGMDGKTHKLSDFKGQFVVLEWWNKDCPYVKKHYESGNMQALQKEYTDKKVVWLSVLSSAPKKQGHLTADEAKKVMADAKASPTTVLLDSSGTVGRAYEAKTTPHMFIIDPKGTLVYMGGIDDKPSADKGSLTGAKNFVRMALDEALAGQPIKVASSKPYGCSVKYQ
jgi:peroxiredoxin